MTSQSLPTTAVRDPALTTPGLGLDPDAARGRPFRVSWGAILAGVAAALVTQLLLNMLGVGIGASAIDIGRGADNSGQAFSIGAGIWWALSGIVGAAVAGLTAGRLAGTARADTARWHGLVSWAVTTLVVVYLLSSAVGGIMGGAFSALGSVANGAGRAAASTASGLASVTDGDSLGQQARQLVDPSGAQSVQDSLAAYLKASLSGDAAAAARARTQAVAGLAASARISPQEAQARVDAAEANARLAYETAKQKATQAAEATRKGVATASILGFVSLVLGALAAWFAGAMGARLHERTQLAYDRVDTRRTTA